MPVPGRLSYGEQLRMLKKPTLWFAISAAIFTDDATFGFFSYLSDYPKSVTELPFTIISIVLFIYGATNIVRNILVCRLITVDARRTIRLTPFRTRRCVDIIIPS